ncbi:RNA ligase RtcB family protein [Neisseria sp. HMSC065C04]|uniref:RNA ligase RtcB family protein n=1 Tax=Neisseria sp. HMSC065C04 TaxID=1739524 RepID=UPI00066BE6BA|nr:RNA ligase RtcB family protein [Neisseria sp. HMSC065C04]OFO67186.1 RNA ligase RtcB family protein [Neisseria sp. HMSC065C04]
MGNYPHHIQIIADSNTWIEGNAVAQLKTTARLPHMLRVAGMPDLHAGRGYPVGAAFFSDRHFYPALIGNDIGCGMAFWQTDLRAAKLKPAKLAKQLGNIDTPLDKDEQVDLLGDAVDTRQFSDGLAVGTIGGGNHFAELQTVDTVYRADLLPPDFDENHLQLLVHSGSRGLGQQILQRHIAAFGHQGLAEEGEAAAAYFAEHQAALEFASLNRRLIAARMLDRWRAEGTCLLDVHHNFLEQTEIDGITGWLHRKGATPTDKGLVMIPGSRGDYSYLVRPAEDCQISLNTLAHGAGRKWQRGECKGRLSHKYTADSLRQTEFGSVVVCQDKALIFEEAPQAYKSIDSVIAAMKNAGLIELVARFKPVLTYKTGGECGA